MKESGRKRNTESKVTAKEGKGNRDYLFQRRIQDFLWGRGGMDPLGGQVINLKFWSYGLVI